MRPTTYFVFQFFFGKPTGPSNSSSSWDAHRGQIMRQGDKWCFNGPGPRVGGVLILLETNRRGVE